MSTKKRASIFDPGYKRLISRLTSLRKEAGVLQEEVAEALGLSQSDISKIEHCERRLDAAEFIQYLHFLVPDNFEVLLFELSKEVFSFENGIHKSK